MKKLTIEVDNESLYREYLNYMQPILKLTNKELEVLAELCKVQSTLPGSRFNAMVLSTETRKAVREKLGMSEAAFNNNISQLKKKELISEVKGVDNRLMLSNDNTVMLVFNVPDK